MFSLGRCNYLNMPDMEMSWSMLAQDSPVLDGRRLGHLDFGKQTCKATKKRRRHPLGIDGISCFNQMPFELFPDFVKEGDRICIEGYPRIYVCRPVEKSDSEDDGKHLIIIGECFVNRRHIFEFDEGSQVFLFDEGNQAFPERVKQFPTTDFIFN